MPHYYPYQLSGGMQQRVAIARALARRPEHPVDGRAVQRARRHDAGRAAGPAALALARPRPHHPVRHPRSRRGALSRAARRSCSARRRARSPRMVDVPLRLSAQADRDAAASRSISSCASTSTAIDGGAGHGRAGRSVMRANLQSMAARTRACPGVILIALLLAFWQFSACTWCDTPTWPPVTRILEAWFENLADGTLIRHLLATLWRQMLGYGLAVLLGRRHWAWRWAITACSTICSSRWSRCSARSPARPTCRCWCCSSASATR